MIGDGNIYVCWCLNNHYKNLWFSTWIGMRRRSFSYFNFFTFAREHIFMNILLHVTHSMRLPYRWQWNWLLRIHIRCASDVLFRPIEISSLTMRCCFVRLLFARALVSRNCKNIIESSFEIPARQEAIQLLILANKQLTWFGRPRLAHIAPIYCAAMCVFVSYRSCARVRRADSTNTHSCGTQAIIFSLTVNKYI